MKIFLLYFIILALLLSMQSQILAQSPDQSNAANNHPEAPPPTPEQNIPVVNNDKQVSDTSDKLIPVTSDKQIPRTNTTSNVTDTGVGASSNTTGKVANDVNYRIDAPSGLAQNGALLRGFYVLLGFSVLTLACFVVKSYRLCHGRQPPAMVKKYGVRAHRTDHEMRRLELDEDDDDTLFEINMSDGRR